MSIHIPGISCSDLGSSACSQWPYCAGFQELARLLGWEEELEDLVRGAAATFAGD
jgi:hypothetical protein